MTGELCIGGRNLARGYLNRPDLTAERFVAHPFDPVPGARVYRTGDLARYRDDGAIEYLGRLDHQVKLRGFRIELGEIEQVLGGHPGVREAIVIARRHAGDTRLVAYLSGDDPPTPGELVTYLKALLPDYMVPAVFVTLPGFPLTPNGKVDRAALPEPEVSRTELATPYEAPQDRVERTIAEVWTRLLGIDQVGGERQLLRAGRPLPAGGRAASRAANATPATSHARRAVPVPDRALARRAPRRRLRRRGGPDSQRPRTGEQPA
nr:hypothetical protein GCM10020092_079950 [Actinoplanes digitatis]